MGNVGIIPCFAVPPAWVGLLNSQWEGRTAALLKFLFRYEKKRYNLLISSRIK
ncbi:hypothetical protein E5S67_00605 [Microcoleus sp. IPMA8]|uniref:Uncharacterized protein n=1 Tax=Microcoleus asticus IPMA8 TaxID=2563858 RepID=A0ABX2CS00_9CYAN|nr:hypothetical protein [Microcoleus asticus IPMA8]